MKAMIAMLLLFVGATGAYAEGRTSYAPVVRKAMLKARIEIEGEQYVRFSMKPNNGGIKIESVVITIERDGKILKTLKPTLRDLPEDASATEYPWEILLPVGKKYLEDTELVHNQEPGSLSMEIAYIIKDMGTSITEVE